MNRVPLSRKRQPPTRMPQQKTSPALIVLDHRIITSLVPMQCTGNSGCFPRGKRAAIGRRSPVFWLCVSCVQCFRDSTIHRTLTRTTGSLTCVRDHSYACICTHGGWARRRRVSTTFLTRQKLSQICLVLWTEFEPLVFGSRVRRSTN